MPPITLSDDELTAVISAARPLPPDAYNGFMQAVALALQGREIGPGTVHRAIVEAQRQFFRPPDIGGPGTMAKYR